MIRAYDSSTRKLRIKEVGVPAGTDDLREAEWVLTQVVDDDGYLRVVVVDA